MARADAGDTNARGTKQGERQHEKQDGTTGQEVPSAVPSDPATEWLVDAFNVISVTLLGGSSRSDWWRAPARERLIERARALPPERGAVWLVFDGRGPQAPDASGGGPHVVFAASADEWILRRAKRAGDGARIVVTGDRRLGDRCRHAGARVISPGEFIAACRADERPEAD